LDLVTVELKDVLVPAGVGNAQDEGARKEKEDANEKQADHEPPAHGRDPTNVVHH
jgi:hypothetical protein